MVLEAVAGVVQAAGGAPARGGVETRGELPVCGRHNAGAATAKHGGSRPSMRRRIVNVTETGEYISGRARKGRTDMGGVVQAPENECMSVKVKRRHTDRGNVVGMREGSVYPLG